MLILISGTNTFFSLKKLAQLRKAFADKFDPSGINIHSIEVTKNGLGDARQALLSQGFLSEKRFVVLRNMFTSITTKPEYRHWLELLSSLPDDVICIVFTSLPIEKCSKSPFYKAMKMTEGVIEYAFPPLSSSRLRVHVETELERLHLRLTSEQISAVMSGTHNDMWALHAELHKLAAAATQNVVDDRLFQALSSHSAMDDMFALMDAISEKRSKQALHLLQRQRLYGSSDIQLLSMLIRQVRLLLQAKSALAHKEDESSLAVPPFLRAKLMKQATLFDEGRLRALHECLFSSDDRVKSGFISADLAVDRIVIGMLAA
ncbi:MAG: DNA polymerase III subunit delta [bacterium]|nr:DNA polymerase III subunit delta [bacterium]MDA1024433.1 DNA polymerase III subunit delta [bacterium]